MSDATFMIEHGPLFTGEIRINKVQKEAEYHVEFEYFNAAEGESFWRSEAVFKTRKEAVDYMLNDDFIDEG